MNANQIRQAFFDFFERKKHKWVASAPIVLKDDPTLMFTNAGMNQFKDYFLNHKKPEFLRVANSQKCLRVSGKHNDLDEVGFDTYHHTMFEMLGNWSFGDYFKKEAIDWAWELLTEVYKLPKERLYATVFGGDKNDNLQGDDEAQSYWLRHLPEAHILYCDKKDNFWEMGDVGPCGPCSEIHLDLRPQAEINQSSGREWVNKDHPLVIEIWNLVFIQYNRNANQTLTLLPKQHIDTGMGLERLVMAIQNKKSNYDTDIFSPFLDWLTQKSGIRYGQNKESDIAMRVISDHLRAICFTIADGQLPSNTGAGYVIRRILRRAVRYGYTFLKFEEPTLYGMVAIVAAQNEGVFDEIKAQQNFIENVVKEEEKSFLNTLAKGLTKFEELQKKGVKKVSGQTAFELYDTYGFPFDLTLQIAKESDLQVDEKGFHEAMKIQKQRSKKDAKKAVGDWTIVHQHTQNSQFVGYEKTECETRILQFRKLDNTTQSAFQIVLEHTPFYAESGGQIGDRGYLLVGDEKIDILNTQKENDLIVHIAHSKPKNPEAVVLAKIDTKARKLIENNHSATHLLHAALRSVLGSHVQQKGSYVHAKGFRFDFSHLGKISEPQLTQIEKRVNQKIRENIEIQILENLPIKEAKSLGAMALFGEKYGEKVRVVIMDKNFSIELCGGTHVKQTGNIGMLKIVNEEAIAAGLRRIEAVTAEEAETFIQEQIQELSTIKNRLKNPKNACETIEKMIQENANLKKEIEQIQKKNLQNLKNKLKEKIENESVFRFLSYKGKFFSVEEMKKLAFDLKNEIPNLILILGGEVQKKPYLCIMLNVQNENQDWDANQIIKEIAKEIDGGGGGQKFFATAGGKNVNGLEKGFEKGVEILKNKIKKRNQ